MKKLIPLSAVLVTLSLAWSACSKHQNGSGAEASNSSIHDRAAGIQWAVPARWRAQPVRPMRVATYSIPAAAGDPEPAECAAYFFGSGQGGSVEANLERWAGQFMQSDGRPAEARDETRQVSGLKIHTINVSGTYLAAAGPMSTVSQTKPNYAMLGAIAEAPQGLVFFKLTGPSKTVDAAKQEFNAMLDSLKPESQSP